MKKIVIMLLLLSSKLLAQQPNQITIQSVYGDDTSVLIEEIINIKFQQNALLFVTTSTSFLIPIEDINNIVFNQHEIESSVENIMEQANINLSLSGNQLSIQSQYAIQSLFLIDMAGKMLINNKVPSATQTVITLPYQGAFVLLLQTTSGYIARKIMHN